MHRMRLGLGVLGLLILLVSAEAHAAISLLGHSLTQNATTGSTRTTTINGQTSGNLNVVSVLWCADSNCATSATGLTISVTDTNGNVYTAVPNTTQAAGATEGIQIFYARNISTATSVNNTITATATGAPWYLTTAASEWSGADAISPEAGLGNHATGSGTTPSISTNGTAQSGDLIYGFVAGPTTPTANQTQIDVVAEYQLATTATTYSDTWTAGSSPWWTAVAVFRVQATGLPSVSPTPLQVCTNQVASANSVVVTCTNPIGAGHAVVAGVFWGTEAATYSVTDNATHTLTKSVAAFCNACGSSGDHFQGLSEFSVAGGPTQFTATFSGVVSFPTLFIYEYSSSVFAEDGGNSSDIAPSTANGADVYSTGRWTTAHAGDLLVGMNALYINSGGGTESAGTGFTSIDTSFNFLNEAKQMGALGTAEGTWSMSGDNGAGSRALSIGMAFQTQQSVGCGSRMALMGVGC